MDEQATRARSRRAYPGTRKAKKQIQEMLDRMARAVTAGDGNAVAAEWTVPAFVVGDTMTQCVSTLDEVATFFSGAKEQYNARAITDTRAEVEKVNWLTRKMVLVQVRWPYLDDRGEEKGDERSTYLLRQDDAGAFKLQVVMMQGASEPPQAASR
jgi:hypothetical protein